MAQRSPFAGREQRDSDVENGYVAVVWGSGGWDALGEGYTALRKTDSWVTTWDKAQEAPPGALGCPRGVGGLGERRGVGGAWLGGPRGRICMIADSFHVCHSETVTTL